MIISASRRTDIPAFYSEWFINRIREGYVLVRNPMNFHQVSKITLNAELVNCIVFWTKDPKNMIDKLEILDEYKYNYYFQFTLNAYDKEAEKNLREKSEIIDTFIELSKKIGREKVIWRYDPIFINKKFSKEYHYNHFEIFASKLQNYTDKCVISFLDLYKNTKRGAGSLELIPFGKKDMLEMAEKLSDIAGKYGIKLATCSEEIELSKMGIEHNRCIDDKLISKIIGSEIKVHKDKGQREICGCVESRDIGAYNTCHHKCLYCYATYSDKIVDKNKLLHNKISPLLLGEIGDKDIITERKTKSIIDDQLRFF